MTMPAYGPVSPYVTPQMLISAPTGISWNTIPPGANVSPIQRLAEQANICGRATSEAKRSTARENGRRGGRPSKASKTAVA